MEDAFGRQRMPHKYKRRFKKDGRFVYVYAPDTAKSFSQAVSGAASYKVVIAHGKPTSILVDNSGMIIFGPPQTLGKFLHRNHNPRKAYFGIAKNADGKGAVYLYPESAVQKAVSKKAAKLLRASRALSLIDRHATELISSPNKVDQQYGLAMYLNNNSKLRIGAHEDAAAVDASERQKIINKARAEGWSDAQKEDVLNSMRKQTFGLLTLRKSHIRMDDRTQSVSFVFRSKGGKMFTKDNVSVRLPPYMYAVLGHHLAEKHPDERVFPNVSYKRVWGFYKRHGITPHTSRTKFADTMVNQIMRDFSVRPNEGARSAMRRFKARVGDKVSKKLGHTSDMTLRSYISETTRKALAEMEKQLNKNSLQEAAYTGNDYLDDLAELMLWDELGVGNTVVV